MPFAYVAHLRTFIIVWLFLLPPMFCTYCGWVTIIAMLAVLFLFLGLDAISSEIENPFGYDWNDLPLGIVPTLLHICNRTLWASTPCLSTWHDNNMIGTVSGHEPHGILTRNSFADIILSQLNADIVEVCLVQSVNTVLSPRNTWIPGWYYLT